MRKCSQQWYTYYLLICAFFGLSYILGGISMLVYGWFYSWYPIAAIVLGASILVCDWFAYKGYQGAAILLIIFYFGNPITMYSAFRILQYLEAMDNHTGFNTRVRERRVIKPRVRERRYHLQRNIMDERDEARYLEKLRNGAESSVSSINSEIIEESKSKQCDVCGYLVSATAKICIKCGNRLE